MPRTGVGAASGHHGELLQGVFEDRNGQLHRGLVTLPLTKLVSQATFTCAATSNLTTHPADKVKAGLAARKTLNHLGVAEGGPIGSSTSASLAIRLVAGKFMATIKSLGRSAGTCAHKTE